jgi:hypothetical protein
MAETPLDGDDRGTPDSQKKSLENAVGEYAETGTSNHPMLIAFFQTQHINLHSGGAVIAPWDLLEGYGLDEWADAAKALSDVPVIRKRIRAQQAVFEKARRQHKHYAQLHGLKPL